MASVAPYDLETGIPSVSAHVVQTQTHRVFMKLSEKGAKMCGCFTRRTALMVLLTIVMFGLVILFGAGASLIGYF
uniref:t-SNARE coiled-coil homology domain-containing protein n=1 Tax=Caenorhabditis tropicalis TaxID=1561998 RepID=A0A1I7TRT5_9PELO